MPFQKIVAEKISSTIIRQIEELILQGVLRPGDRLPSERDLAETMAVSRPTLREALAELEQRGLVVARPGGGTYVAEVLGSAFSAPLIEIFATHDSALFDYVAFRRDLEGLAAERAAVNATPTDLEVIDSVYRRMEEAARSSDTEAAGELDAEFHMAIVEAAHNVVMMHMMRSLYELLVHGVFYNRNVIYGRTTGPDDLMAQHREIRDRVMARDPGGARAAVERHMDYVANALHEADRIRSREEIAELRHRHEQRRADRGRGRRPTPPRAIAEA